MISCYRYFHIKRTVSKDHGESEAHIYDEIRDYAKVSTVLKSQNTLVNCKDDNVIFEVSTSQMPAYQSIIKPVDDSHSKTKNNDYYIDGEDNTRVENIYKEREYPVTSYEMESQNDHAYNKLMHLK